MKILIVSSTDSDAIETLREQHDAIYSPNPPDEELRSLLVDRDVLIFRSGVNITAEEMACAPNLTLLIRAGSGLDNLDVEYAQAHSIELIRIPGPGAQAVAELAFTLMFALSRRVLEADRLLQKGHWAKSELAGYLLKGKVLGIIGVGNIGSRVGQIGTALGMQVLGYDASPSPANELAEKGIRLSDFDEVLAQADYLSIHVPLMDSTRSLIGADAFSRMKPGAFLINLARGGVVDESALHTALTEPRRLRGAALDVHENEGEGKISPLAGLPNVILTPHIGSSTVDTQHEIGRHILESIAAVEAKSKGKTS